MPMLCKTIRPKPRSREVNKNKLLRGKLVRLEIMQHGYANMRQVKDGPTERLSHLWFFIIVSGFRSLNRSSTSGEEEV